jgi:hypothetical protein
VSLVICLKRNSARGGAKSAADRNLTRDGNQSLHFWPFDIGATTFDDGIATCLRQGTKWLFVQFKRSLVLTHVSPTLNSSSCSVSPFPLSKNRPLSVTMKFSHTLAAALFLPVLVNAQNQNGNVTVSGILSTASTIRSIDAP